MNVETLAKELNAHPDLKAGSLRFWGDWFGKPYDNFHKVMQCTADGDLLVIDFDGGERLCIRHPEGVIANSEVFRIKSAAWVRWEWFYYGRARTAENRYFFEYVNNGSGIIASTNVDWYTPILAPSRSEVAVEIL